MTGSPEVKNRFDGSIIIPAGKYASLKEAVEKEYKNLSSADLRYADLSSANLRSADLSSADLRFADLPSADLRFANLSSANLSYADLRSADLSSADLRSADLPSANLSSADLRFADLSSANLSSADLRFADLRFANLSSANLSSANLRYADLRFADRSSIKYKEPLFLPDLYCLKLLSKDTKLTFWKYLRDGKSPYQDFPYEVGKEYEFEDADKDEQKDCSNGGNVATLMWCLKDSAEANEFIEVEFSAGNIVAVPFSTDGKFRVKSFRVLRKINRKDALKLLTKVMKGTQ